MTLLYGSYDDIPSWAGLVKEVSGHFPGLETDEKVQEHMNTVREFMARQEALCVKERDNVLGVLLFSKQSQMICCLAVSPMLRRRGIAAMLLSEALRHMNREKDISVSTYREGDEKGIAARALYEKFGFTPGKLTEEFGYPNQEFVLRPDS